MHLKISILRPITFEIENNKITKKEDYKKICLKNLNIENKNKMKYLVARSGAEIGYVFVR